MVERKHTLKNLPNTVTAFRIAGAFALLFAQTGSTAFFALYLLCGLTDILDGFLARQLQAASKFGSKLDSIADLLFALSCAIKFLSVIRLNVLQTTILSLVVCIKLLSFFISIIRRQKRGSVYFFHTVANKITGCIVFAGLPMLFSPYEQFALAIMLLSAAFASIQELVFNICNAEIAEN